MESKDKIKGELINKISGIINEKAEIERAKGRNVKGFDFENFLQLVTLNVLTLQTIYNKIRQRS